MSLTVLFVPSSPMLLPDYVGLVDPLEDLRTRCAAALSGVLGGGPDARPPVGGTGTRVVVVTGQAATAHPALEPLGLRVGRHLLGLAGWSGGVDATTEVVVPAEGPVPEAAVAVLTRALEAVGREREASARHTVLLVVGDGSARRGETAPGYLDERSFGVDETVLAALAVADTATLRALDPALCDELLVTGRAPLQAVATALAHVDLRGGVLWSGDPYGVRYWLARWREP